MTIITAKKIEEPGEFVWSPQTLTFRDEALAAIRWATENSEVEADYGIGGFCISVHLGLGPGSDACPTTEIQVRAKDTIAALAHCAIEMLDDLEDDDHYSKVIINQRQEADRLASWLENAASAIRSQLEMQIKLD